MENFSIEKLNTKICEWDFLSEKLMLQSEQFFLAQTRKILCFPCSLKKINKVFQTISVWIWQTKSVRKFKMCFCQPNCTWTSTKYFRQIISKESTWHCISKTSVWNILWLWKGFAFYFLNYKTSLKWTLSCSQTSLCLNFILWWKMLLANTKQLLLCARVMPTGSSLWGQQAKKGMVNCHTCYRVGWSQWWINDQKKPEQGFLLILHLSWVRANNKMMSGENQSDCLTFCINHKWWPKVTETFIKHYLRINSHGP